MVDLKIDTSQMQRLRQGVRKMAEAIATNGVDHSSVRREWLVAVSELLHSLGVCGCLGGGECIMAMTTEQQDIFLPVEHDLSFQNFMVMAKEAMAMISS